MKKDEKNNMGNWFEQFKNNKFVIHCETEEQADKFMKILHKKGITWCNHEKTVKNSNYKSYGNKTCYSYTSSLGISFSGKAFFESEMQVIIKFSDIFKSQSTTEIIKIIRKDKKTIVILPDGRKGISKCLPTDGYDEYKGFLLAYCRAVYGKQVTYDSLYGGLKNYPNKELLTEVEKRMK